MGEYGGELEVHDDSSDVATDTVAEMPAVGTESSVDNSSAVDSSF
jgi:hypothetical protein